MKYRIVIEKPAAKFILKQTKEQQTRILKAIYSLPDIGDVKKMQGTENLFRLRVGTYRILYTIEDQVLIIRVLEAGNRGDIYK